MSTSASAINDGADSVLKSAISKVKHHVLPLFVIMFIVNYIDRVNIGFVRAHMEQDLASALPPTALVPACSSSVTRCSKSLPTCFCKKSARASG